MSPLSTATVTRDEWDRRANQYRKEIADAGDELDRERVAELCGHLLANLERAPFMFPDKPARSVLKTLRNMRLFDRLERVAEALIKSGQNAFEIRRQLAQAQIEQCKLDQAIEALRSLIKDTVNDGENSEARGLLGRALKQRHIQLRTTNSTTAAQALRDAVGTYFQGYQSSKTTEEFLWHGINAVALLRLGARAGIGLPGYPDPIEMGRNILEVVEELHRDHKATTWDFATAVEACVALGLAKDSMRWVVRYARSPYTGEFALASTRRQLEEVWGLTADLDTDFGPLMVFLEAELLHQSRGLLDTALTPTDWMSQLKTGLARNRDFESMFPDGALTSVKWFALGDSRSRIVAKIESELTFVGTGFLIRGVDLIDELGAQWILMTNAHVISDNPAEAARQSGKEVLNQNEAQIRFTLAGNNSVWRARAIVWSSLPNDLDATLVLLDEAPPSVESYSIAKNLPVANGTEPVWVISHPEGKDLSFSSRNNVLLGVQGTRLRYRAATKGGSSGGPVFNNEWKLIGVHHANATELSTPDGGIQGPSDNPGARFNEGVSIQSIREELSKPDIKARVLARARGG